MYLKDKSVRKNIVITESLYERSMVKANEMGLSFLDYVRFLLALDLRNSDDNRKKSEKIKDKWMADKSISDIKRKKLQNLNAEIYRNKFE